MNPAKIQLSPDELLLVQNAEWLLTKNRIIEKVYAMFGLLAADVQRLLSENNFSWPEALTISPKIFKGENYKGLPYVMLDYPRCFSREDIFAIRTMFWWGNFFSTTLHVRGRYKRYLESTLKEQMTLLKNNDVYISTHADEWRHDFEADNYASLSHASEKTIHENLSNKEFCKLSGKIPLYEWDNAPVKLLQLYQILLAAMQVSSRGDETGL